MNIQPPSNSADARAKREEDAWDEGAVWDENRKLFKKFHHVFNCPHNTEVDAWFRGMLLDAARGKRVLELGCFDGTGAKKLLSEIQCDYTGMDVSSVAIERARSLNLPNAKFFAGDAAATGLESNDYDVVFGTAILHHLPWEQCILEIKRLLRPGGFAFFAEPLIGNPISKLYRAITPKARTPDELPLSRAQVEWADRQFVVANHRFSSLASMYAGAVTSFLPLSSDNFLLKFTQKIDSTLEKTSLKYWMRYGYFVWRK